MKTDVLLGLQWGDEGKGKIIDVLSENYDIVARFQGGPNAGHTLEFNDIKHVLHTIPSGIFRENKINVIGNGVVLDPISFRHELESTAKRGGFVYENLFISRKAHLILPTHRMLDAANEKAKGNDKIGSTLKGIGPAYTDKTARMGLRVGDTELTDFKFRYEKLRDYHLKALKQMNFEFDLEREELDWFSAIEEMKKIRFIDSEFYINDALSAGKSILAEGAQGSLLDIDFGSYPFVTSSNTCCAGVCSGLGVAPSKIGEVFGVFKAYCTRVGSGPFPTELFDETGLHLREKGHEFGSTTGRPRRCGWLDLVALKYAVMLNGVTKLYMMKADVLDELPTIKVCVAYKYQNQNIDYIPYDIKEPLTPVYKEFSGWNCDISKITKVAEIPTALNEYIRFIENAINVPVDILSVGPNRKQTLKMCL